MIVLKSRERIIIYKHVIIIGVGIAGLTADIYAKHGGLDGVTGGHLPPFPAALVHLYIDRVDAAVCRRIDALAEEPA